MNNKDRTPEESVMREFGKALIKYMPTIDPCNQPGIITPAILLADIKQLATHLIALKYKETAYGAIYEESWNVAFLSVGEGHHVKMIGKLQTELAIRNELNGDFDDENTKIEFLTLLKLFQYARAFFKEP